MAGQVGTARLDGRFVRCLLGSQRGRERRPSSDSLLRRLQGPRQAEAGEAQSRAPHLLPSQGAARQAAGAGSQPRAPTWAAGAPGGIFSLVPGAGPCVGHFLKVPFQEPPRGGRQPWSLAAPGRKVSHRCSSSSHRWPCAVRRPGQRGRGLPGGPSREHRADALGLGPGAPGMGQGCVELACTAGVTVARCPERYSRWLPSSGR